MPSCETEWWTVCQILKAKVWIKLSTTAYAWHRQNATLCTLPNNIYIKSQKCWLDIAQTLFTIKKVPERDFEEKVSFQWEKNKTEANSHLVNLSGQSSKYYFWKVVSLPEAHTEWLNFWLLLPFIFLPCPAILCHGSTLLELGLKLWATTARLIGFLTPWDPEYLLP